MQYRKKEIKKYEGCLYELFLFLSPFVLTFMFYYYDKKTIIPIQKFILSHNKEYGALFWQYTHFRDHFFGTLLGAVVLCYVIYKIISFIDDFIFKQFMKLQIKREDSNNKKSAFMWLGAFSTGYLLLGGHGSGIAGSQNIFMGLEDCCLNFVCFGGIGSGKTSRLVLPLVYNLTRNYPNAEIGGLVFDVKGDFGGQFRETAKAGTQIIKIGVGADAVGFNLLDGLSPELASSYLNSALILGNGTNDKFWVESATQLIKNVLGILRFCDGCYNLKAAYKFIFNADFAVDRKKEALENVINAGIEIDIEKVNICLEYLTDVYANFDDKVQQSIKATVSTVLEPFQQPELASRFCDSSAKTVSIYEILSGKFLLVDLPLAVWGMGAKVIYTMIKLRFFSMVQERVVNTKLNQNIPCIFICDEYQDIISVSSTGLSDLSFWDKSRSAKCIGIISSQSISSFRAACHDRDLADTVLQNFRQKFCFRTEDLATIEYFQRLAGDTEHRRIVQSSGRSGGQPTFGESEQYYRENVISQQMIRSLDQQCALGFLNIGGKSYDDVYLMWAYYNLLKKGG